MKCLMICCTTYQILGYLLLMVLGGDSSKKQNNKHLMDILSSSKDMSQPAYHEMHGDLLVDLTCGNVFQLSPMFINCSDASHILMTVLLESSLHIHEEQSFMGPNKRDQHSKRYYCVLIFYQHSPTNCTYLLLETSNSSKLFLIELAKQNFPRESNFSEKNLNTDVYNITLKACDPLHSFSKGRKHILSQKHFADPKVLKSKNCSQLLLASKCCSFYLARTKPRFSHSHGDIDNSIQDVMFQLKCYNCEENSLSRQKRQTSPGTIALRISKSDILSANTTHGIFIGVNASEVDEFYKSARQKQQRHHDADAALLCTVFIFVAILFGLHYLRGFHNRNTHLREVSFHDNSHLLTVEEVLYRKRHYLPMFSDNDDEEVFVHDCGHDP